MLVHISPHIESPQAEFLDRRRPGRIEDVRPELLPLVRRSELLASSATLSIEHVDPGGGDGLSAARGIALAVVLSGVIWAAIWFLAPRLF